MRVVRGLLAGLVLVGSLAVEEVNAREKSPVKSGETAQIMEQGFDFSHDPLMQQEQRAIKLKAPKKVSFLKQKIREPESEIGERLETEVKIFEAKAFEYEREFFATKSDEFEKNWEATKDGKHEKEKLAGEWDKSEGEKLAFYQGKRSKWDRN